MDGSRNLWKLMEFLDYSTNNW